MQVIESYDLTKIYNNRYIALNALNLHVEKGMVYGLVGPNGAGKSTTFRILLGLQHPTAGTARLFGEDMTPERADLRRRIGFLPTNPSFPRNLTPISYLEFVGSITGMPNDRTKIRLATLLQAVDLTGVASQRIEGLSTGMVTRLGIAAALMNDPELLILDEPTSGLDPAGRKHTIELIRELSGRDRTIIIATHILGDVERVCTDVGIISQGRLIYSGPMSEMRRLARHGTIAVEIEGNTHAFEQQIPLLDDPGQVRWERLGAEFRISFLGDAPLPVYMHRVLDLIGRTGVALLHLNTGSDEIEEAFLRRLEEDRTRGFLRASSWVATLKLAGADRLVIPDPPPARPLNGNGNGATNDAPYATPNSATNDAPYATPNSATNDAARGVAQLTALANAKSGAVGHSPPPSPFGAALTPTALSTTSTEAETIGAGLLVLLRYDLGQMGRSWIARAWIALLVFPALFLVGVAASENELASQTMWAYMAAVLAPLSWLAVSIYSASAVNGESNVLADSILSKSVTRSEYLAAKLVSRVGFTVAIYFAVTIPLAVLLARYAAPDTTPFGVVFALTQVGAMLGFLATAGILLSTLFKNSQLSILCVMALVLTSGAALQFFGLDSMSVTAILTNLPSTLRGQTSVWAALRVVIFFGLLGVAAGSAALWTFRRKDL